MRTSYRHTRTLWSNISNFQNWFDIFLKQLLGSFFFFSILFSRGFFYQIMFLMIKLVYEHASRLPLAPNWHNTRYSASVGSHINNKSWPKINVILYFSPAMSLWRHSWYSYSSAISTWVKITNPWNCAFYKHNETTHVLKTFILWTWRFVYFNKHLSEITVT